MLRPVAIAPRAAALVVVAAILGTAGCGAKKNDLAPAACLVGNESYLNALQRAPAQVRLAGTTPISDCLVPEQDAGQLADIGHEMIIAATKLNAEARRNPSGAATLQLGYLSGAVAKGADPIHTDLIRRINSAAQFTLTGATPPASFERAFGRGYAAGHSSG